ncbi:MAG: hypothetical protein ACYC9P_07885 [Rudaea sp.]
MDAQNDTSKFLAELAALTNRLAEKVMGWHTQPSGATPWLWRDSNEVIVRYTIHGCRYSICRHPWAKNRNRQDEISFSPVFNYHADHLIDWFAVLMKSAQAHGIGLREDGDGKVRVTLDGSDIGSPHHKSNFTGLCMDVEHAYDTKHPRPRLRSVTNE